MGAFEWFGGKKGEKARAQMRYRERSEVYVKERSEVYAKEVNT